MIINHLDAPMFTVNINKRVFKKWWIFETQQSEDMKK